MDAFEVIGGKQLKGEIVPQGAKNEALQILCAVLLTSDEVIIENIPDIHDVNMLIRILGELGVTVKNLGNSTYSFTAKDINVSYLQSIALFTFVAKA